MLNDAMKKLTFVQDSISSSQEEDDQERIFKILGGFFKFLDTLSLQISNKPEFMKSFYDWTKQYLQQCTVKNPDTYKPALILLFKLTNRVKIGPSIFKDLAFKIRAEVGNLDDNSQVRYFFDF